jgi:hypothetical protein
MDYLLFVFVAVYFVPGLVRSGDPVGIAGAVVLMAVGIPSLVATLKNAYNYFRQRKS